MREALLGLESRAMFAGAALPLAFLLPRLLPSL